LNVSKLFYFQVV